MSIYFVAGLAVVFLVVITIASKISNKSKLKVKLKATSAELTDSDIITSSQITFPGITTETGDVTAMLSQYGIDKDSVLAVGSAAESSFSAMPSSLTAILEGIYEKGDTRGTEVADFIFNKMILSPTQKVYFVLTGKGQTKQHLSVIAFVS